MRRLSLKNVTLISFVILFCFTLMLLWNLVLLSQESKSKKSSANQHDNENQHRLAVIVPFRERFNQLLQFIPHMNSFLQRQNIIHDFYIINQVDNYRFNRGSLINVGFELAKNQSSYIAMHDVDLLPLNDQLSYRFPTDGPFHVSSPELHPKYHYRSYVGGILLIKNEQFEMVNGFSTNYYGWGLEGLRAPKKSAIYYDDEFYARLKEANLKVLRPQYITTNSTNTFAHIHDQTQYRRDTAKLFNQKEVTRKRDRQTGLNSTKFQLKQIHNITLQDVSFRVYDVALQCDLTKTPWCQRKTLQ